MIAVGNIWMKGDKINSQWNLEIKMKNWKKGAEIWNQTLKKGKNCYLEKNGNKQRQNGDHKKKGCS